MLSEIPAAFLINVLLCFVAKDSGIYYSRAVINKVFILNICAAFDFQLKIRSYIILITILGLRTEITKNKKQKPAGCLTTRRLSEFKRRI